MARKAATRWVTVKAAADELGLSESRIRAAYRSGQLAVKDKAVAGRMRKVVDLAEARTWALGPVPVADGALAMAVVVEPEPEPQPEPEPAPVPVLTLALPMAPAVAVDDDRIAELTALAERALARAERASDQVAYLRNELAQLRDAHLRIQADIDRRNAEHLRTAARLACNDKPTRAPRGGILRLVVRRAAN